MSVGKNTNGPSQLWTAKASCFHMVRPMLSEVIMQLLCVSTPPSHYDS